jgi:hypothetical protein
VVSDREHVEQLIQERALARETLDAGAIRRIKEDMERAEARRLQPHFIASFFIEAFRHLGGSIREREPRRYEITHVPAAIRNRDRLIGVGQAVLPRYERVTFHKDLISVQGKPLASFVCPSHPLLDCTIDLVLERYRDLLKRGALLVDPREESGEEVRALFYIEHSIQDGRTDRQGNRLIASRQMQFVEMDKEGQARLAGYAPYLDYRPITDDERKLVEAELSASWLKDNLEDKAVSHAIEHLVPNHLGEVKRFREELVAKTMAAVKDRLTKEINYWDHRAEELKVQEQAGKVNARINSGKARERANDLEARLRKRLEELEQERRLSPLPPVIMGGALVVPKRILDRLAGTPKPEGEPSAEERRRIDRLAVATVMEMEKRLGRVPREMPHENPGYDVESQVPEGGRLLFIEVKGVTIGKTTVTISKTQILTALNKPDHWILAIVQVDGDAANEPAYVRQPFQKEPDFGVTSVNYNLTELLAKAEAPS